MTRAPAVVPAATPAPVSPTGRRYGQLVLVLGALIALGPLTIDMYLPALPSMADELAASDSAVQLTITGMLGGLAVGQLVIGPLSDAFGRRRPLIVGVLTHGLASLLCAVSPTIEMLSVVRVLQGFAGAAISVVAMAIVRDLFDGVAMAQLMSRLMLVIGVAPILAPSLGGFVLEWTSWRGIFVVLAGAAALLILVAVFAVRETLPVERRRSARLGATLGAYRMLVKDTTFVALVLIAGLMMAALIAYVSGSSFVLQGAYGLDARTFALVFGANAGGLVLATQVNPLLLRRFGPAAVLSGALLVAIAAAALLVLAAVTGVGGLVGVLVPLAVIIMTCGLSLPNTPALALTRHGEAAGTAAALLGSAQFGVGAVIAPLVGAFGGRSAMPMGVVMLVVTTLAAGLMFFVVRRDASVGLR
ncbi:MAG: multidrug effflux MFS transporter [Nocardioidaceae bacterium]